MTATVVLKKATRRVWLRHRARGLGGTDVAAVLGMSPWRTPLQVWLDKTDPQPDARDGGNWAMRRGRHLEKLLVAEYGRLHEDVVLERPPALLAHPDRPWLRASLDHLAHHPDRTVVLEVKTAGWRAARDWWDGAMPDQYAVQVLTYLAVTGLGEAHIIADLAGDIDERIVMRDLEWEAAALPLLDEFWHQHVQGGVPPDVDFARDRIPDLNRAWQPTPGSTAEATPEQVGLLGRIDQANTAAKQRDRLRVELRASMGDVETLTVDGQKTAWTNTRGAFTTRPLPKENDD